MQTINRLIDSIKGSPIVWKGDYPYFCYSLSDGVLPIDSLFLKDVCIEMMYGIDPDMFKWCDYILAPEAMGLPIATMLSYITDVPWLVIRKRKYGLPGELELNQQTGYSKNVMYINGLKSGDTVIIVDDVVSTGGTLRAIFDTLRNNDIDCKGAYTLIEKNGSSKKLQSEGYPVGSLVNVITDQSGIKDVIPSGAIS